MRKILSFLYSTTKITHKLIEHQKQISKLHYCIVKWPKMSKWNVTTTSIISIFGIRRYKRILYLLSFFYHKLFAVVFAFHESFSMCFCYINIDFMVGLMINKHQRIMKRNTPNSTIIIVIVRITQFFFSFFLLHVLLLFSVKKGFRLLNINSWNAKNVS